MKPSASMMRPSRRRTTPLLLLAATLVWACASPEERFAEHLERGEQNIEEDKPREALIEFRNALKIQPKNADINERIGDLLRDQRAFADATFFYREAYRLDPDRVDIAMQEARLLRLDRMIENGKQAEKVLGQRLRANVIGAGPVNHGPRTFDPVAKIEPEAVTA